MAIKSSWTCAKLIFTLIAFNNVFPATSFTALHRSRSPLYHQNPVVVPHKGVKTSISLPLSSSRKVGKTSIAMTEAVLSEPENKEGKSFFGKVRKLPLSQNLFW